MEGINGRRGDESGRVKKKDEEKKRLKGQGAVIRI